MTNVDGTNRHSRQPGTHGSQALTAARHSPLDAVDPGRSGLFIHGLCARLIHLPHTNKHIHIEHMTTKQCCELCAALPPLAVCRNNCTLGG